jgi:hypothetical protein
MISILYPVRSYACTEECTWRGLLPSLSSLERRNRQIRLVFAFLVIAVAAGLVVWKFGADLTWSPAHPPAGDGVEEAAGSAAQ